MNENTTVAIIDSIRTICRNWARNHKLKFRSRLICPTTIKFEFHSIYALKLKMALDGSRLIIHNCSTSKIIDLAHPDAISLLEEFMTVTYNDFICREYRLVAPLHKMFSSWGINVEQYHPRMIITGTPE